ncbi:hypothetical protein HELRODRAFT_161965 [Helobdella robusta]|uniref:Serine/threonine-protein kinase TOR n=1 Tax=Helobdella robusta TaxID=6412 RepID=T1ES35_HELRO|nr:hypothetical protein HELRODRAFT_161965 [Helobdella robusta]ESO02673.1 hypothetical protein HELRODRAFT_161965 [Helobdella robusta]
MSVRENIEAFFKDLKNPSEEIRQKAGQELFTFIQNDLKPLVQDEINNAVELMLAAIRDILQNSSEKKGALLAINMLMKAELTNNNVQLLKLSPSLHRLIDTQDFSLIRATTDTLCQMMIMSSSADMFAAECNFYFDWLASGPENKKYAALQIRESAARALGSALNVASMKYLKSDNIRRPEYYKRCFDDIEKPYDEMLRKKVTQDDWLHGSMLIFLELLKCCNAKAENLASLYGEGYKKHWIHTMMAPSSSKNDADDDDDADDGDDDDDEDRVDDDDDHGDEGYCGGDNDQKTGSGGAGNDDVTGDDGDDDRDDDDDDDVCENVFVKELMAEKMTRITVYLLKLRQSKSSFIHSSLLSIIPRIASFNPNLFYTNFLLESMKYLFSMLKVKECKSRAFIAIGQIALALGPLIKSHKEAILREIQAALTAKKHKIVTTSELEASIFFCFSMLVLGLNAGDGLVVLDELKGYVDSMAKLGLRTAISSLRGSIVSVPLLTSIGSLQTCGVSMSAQTTSPNFFQMISGQKPVARQVTRQVISEWVPNVGILKMALHTLRKFDFGDNSLLDLAMRVHESFLSNEDKAVRIESIKTLTKIFAFYSNVRLLSEMEYSNQDGSKIVAAKLLSHLSRCTPSFLESYRTSILDAILPKLRTSEGLSSAVVVAMLAALGDLVHVSGERIGEYSDAIINILISIMQETMQTAKQEEALRTLGLIVESTGCVVEPYLKYPQLLEVLLQFFKTEQSITTRTEAIKVLGILGALDPYKHRGLISQGVATELGAVLSMSENKGDQDVTNQDLSMNELLVSMSMANMDDYYPAFYKCIALAISTIFKEMGLKCVPYLNQVVPGLTNGIKGTTDCTYREFLLRQLGVIIGVVKQNIRPYLFDVFALEFWSTTASTFCTIMDLLEQLVVAIESEFRNYLPNIVPLILQILDSDDCDVIKQDRIVISRLLQALQVFGKHLEDYLHFILPTICSMIDNEKLDVTVRGIAIETLSALTDHSDLTAYASRIFHPAARALATAPQLHDVLMDLTTLLTLMERGDDGILKRTRQLSRFTTDQWLLNNMATSLSGSSGGGGGVANNHSNSSNAWLTSHRVTRDEWLDWLRRLSLELLKESPSPALRALYPLANDYNLLARDLFNPAFVSCWLELNETNQDSLINSLQHAFKFQDAVEVTQAILNLAEFMEHCENSPLPLDLSMLSDCAVQCRAYAKALHFKEAEFYKGPTNQILESLISINSKMQQPEAASGVLEYVRKHNKSDLRVQERWYEKLHHWDRALIAYDQQQERDPDNSSYLLGRVRCLEALGEWGKLHEITTEKWPLVNETVKQDMARMSATAAWGLCDFFFRSVINLHNDNFNAAHKLITQARNLLITELSTLVGESYNRAYGVMVNVQMLSELDEVISYKVVPEKREMIKEIWWNRIRGCQDILEDWQKILQIRSLVLDPQDDVRPWLKYVGLCRKNNRSALAGRTLTSLLGGDPYKFTDEKLIGSNPKVVFAYLKYLWDEGAGKKAKQEVVKYYNEATKHNKDWVKAWHSFAYANYDVLSTLKEAKSNETISDDPVANILASAAATAATTTPSSPLPTTATTTSSSTISTTHLMAEHCKASIRGFLKSIALSDACSTLQDSLRILTMWFEYGNIPEVNGALVEGVKTVAINNWIQVIPQLIARIDTPRPLVGRLVIQLLKDIGRQHPQALIYPLVVVSKSQVQTRSHAANVVLKNMKEHSSVLVQQAMLVSEELIRVAILWHELWHEGLEEASRLYFGDRNIPAMLNVLEPLHQMLVNGPQTQKEIAFIQSYGHDLNIAHECCRRYQLTRNNKELTQAWDLYYQEYQFLLKGHEDLRQDERVMQLFGLVNSILLTNQQIPKRNLSIHRYAVIPLSTNSGLIGWVPNCDTLHSLIRDYRDRKKILLNIEHRIMLRMSQDYDHLTLMQKIEVFEHALENTNGDDLAKILWVKSPSSEIWFDRRTNYTRSLAVMSMVGYILGLGDRHPSNLMLDRISGKIMHIDFGDCFEVAMTREKFPEKIPFRLTRMLVNAMEVTGIEGNYRLTCERVMRVLRSHKDSLMAVLEAFVYDPLLNWRLMEANIREPKNSSIAGPYNTANDLDFSTMEHSYASLKRVHESSLEIIIAAEGDAPPEELNKKALSIINRVRDKLTGKDFNTTDSIDVPSQVSQLIEQATLHENLCQCYIGWCPFW